MTEEEKIKIVERRLDKVNFCQEGGDSRCTTPSGRFWRNPVDRTIWEPCLEHLGLYLVSTWKEIR